MSVARLVGQEELCHANCVRTLEMVRQMKRATRRQLEAMTGFSVKAVNVHVGGVSFQ